MQVEDVENSLIPPIIFKISLSLFLPVLRIFKFIKFIVMNGVQSLESQSFIKMSISFLNQKKPFLSSHLEHVIINIFKDMLLSIYLKHVIINLFVPKFELYFQPRILFVRIFLHILIHSTVPSYQMVYAITDTCTEIGCFL